MAMLHQEIDTVFFGSNGVRVGFGDALQHLNVRDIQFVAAGGALIGANFAFYYYAGFLGETFDGFEDFGSDGILRDYTLNDAGAVTKLGKEKLATFAEVVEPSADGDGLAFVLADFCDGADGSRHAQSFKEQKALR